MSVDVVWPYKPNAELIESLEWKTDVLRTKTKEQRIALRPSPRRIFSLSHMFKSRDYSNSRIVMRDAESFLLPDWTLAQPITDVIVGLSTPILFSTINMGLAIGNEIILWQSSESYQIVEIESFDDNGIVAVETFKAMDLAEALPLLSALPLSDLSVSRTSNDIASVSLEMLVKNTVYIGASTYSQYRGHDIMPLRPTLSVGSIEESVSWPLSFFDNEFGIPVLLRERSVPDETLTLSWETADQNSTFAMRKWLHSRKGKQKAFWASSWAQDLALAVNISSVTTTITIYALPNLVNLGRTAFDIDIMSIGGTHYYRQVTNVVAGTPVGGKATLNLTISSSLGVALTIAQVDRISFFRCVRFNSDRVELRHLGGDMCAVIVPCIEVPVP